MKKTLLSTLFSVLLLLDLRKEQKHLICSYTKLPGANVELYTFENVDTPIYKEELSMLRYFRIEGLKRKAYILKVVPTGPNVYKYNSSVTQLDLAHDQDQVLTRLGEKHLSLTLYRLERKAVAKSRLEYFFFFFFADL